MAQLLHHHQFPFLTQFYPYSHFLVSECYIKKMDAEVLTLRLVSIKCKILFTFYGLYLNIYDIKSIASLLAVGINVFKDYGLCLGNLKPTVAANLYPSGHSSLLGVPITEHILTI